MIILLILVETRIKMVTWMILKLVISLKFTKI